jgi:hypothetical protein
MTVYISGSFKDYKSASDYKNAVIEKGVKDAFVIAYYYGKKISVAEAKSMQAGSNVVSTTNVGTTSNTNTSAINSNNNAATQTTNINKANTNNTAINNTSNTTKVNTTETNPVTVVKRIEKDTTSNNLKNNHVVSTTDTAKAHVTEIKPNNIAAQTNDNKPKDTTSSNLKNNHAASVVDTAKTNTTEIKPANVAVQNKIKDTTINNLTKNHAVDTVKARVTEIKPNTDNKKTTDTINNNQLSSSNVKPNNISTDQNTTISTNNTDTTNHASNNEIKNFHIIASFYTNEQDAKNDVEILKSKGFKDAEVIKSVSNHGYYVSYKAYSSNKEAQYDLSVIKHLVNPLAWIYEKNEQ